MEVESWSGLIGKFDLVPADAENLSSWLEVIDGWVNSSANALSSLKAEALEVLLMNEGLWLLSFDF